MSSFAAIILAILVATEAKATTPQSLHLPFSLPVDALQQLQQRPHLKADPGCPAQPSLVPLPAPPAGLVGALTSLLQAGLNGTGASGAAIAVHYLGSPLLQFGLGTANKSTGVAVDPVTTLFRIGSVSKLFPAIALFQLVSLGLLPSLDEPLSAFAQDLQPINPFSTGGDITFRHLVAQLSGLQREAPYGYAVNDTAGVFEAVSRSLLVYPPGAYPSYSNLGFGVLGHVLAERVWAAAGACAGPLSDSNSRASLPPCDLSSLVSSLITGPGALNMTGTGFDYTPEVMSRLAVGYMSDGSVAPWTDLGWAYPAGSMHASVSDLAGMGDALLRDAGAIGEGGQRDKGKGMIRKREKSMQSGLNLSSSLARELLAVDFWNRDGLTLYGAPWEIRPRMNYTVLHKGGNIPGYTSLFTLIPDLGLSMAVTWNGGVDEFAFGDAAADAIISSITQALLPLQPQPAADPGPSPADYVGIYEVGGSPSGAVQVTQASDGMLVWYAAAPLGFSVGLQWVGSGFPPPVEMQAAGAVEVDYYSVYIPSQLMACLGSEMTALVGQYVAFGRTNATATSSAGARLAGSGSATGPVVISMMGMLGWIPGTVWAKVQ